MNRKSGNECLPGKETSYSLWTIFSTTNLLITGSLILVAPILCALMVPRDPMMRAPFQTNAEYLKLLAKDIGVDREQFLADMQSDEVADELRRSRALAFSTSQRPT